MKTVIIFMIFAKLNFARTGMIDASRGDGFFEGQFNKTLECIKKIYANDVSSFPLSNPVLVNFNHKLLRINMVFTNVTMYGIAEYYTHMINLSGDAVMDLNLTIPEITITGSYSGQINLLGLYEVYGEGTFLARIFNVDVLTTIQHGLQPPLVRNVDAVMNVEETKITMTDLMDDEDFSSIFSNFASVVAPQLINGLQKNISAALNPVLKDAVNSLLGDFSFLDYLAMITTYTCN